MKVGIQLYSVKESMSKDPLGTMKKVAEVGYKNWETCELFGAEIENNYGMAGLSAKEAVKFLNDNGIQIIGTHVSPMQMEKPDELSKLLDYNAEVGCWSPGLAADFWESLDDLKQKCELYNKVGEKCKEMGMVFHYHNHFHEFQKFGDKTLWDLLCEFTDPSLVKLEVDTYWVARAGLDPNAIISKDADRVIMIHQKDFPKNLDKPLSLFDYKFDYDKVLTGISDFYSLEHEDFIEVGTGCLPIQSYIDTANKAGVKYITLEQDFTVLDEIESIEVSMAEFKKFTGIEWA